MRSYLHGRVDPIDQYLAPLQSFSRLDLKHHVKDYCERLCRTKNTKEVDDRNTRVDTKPARGMPTSELCGWHLHKASPLRKTFSSCKLGRMPELARKDSIEVTKEMKWSQQPDLRYQVHIKSGPYMYASKAGAVYRLHLFQKLHPTGIRNSTSKTYLKGCFAHRR